jgi:hypothetical protein
VLLVKLTEESFLVLPEETGSDVSSQSSIGENYVDIRETINELLDAAPSFDRSALREIATRIDELKDPDVSHTRQKFPNADPELVKRLGVAASHRRHYLMDVLRAPKSHYSSKSHVPPAISETSYEGYPRPEMMSKVSSAIPEKPDSHNLTTATSATLSKHHNSSVSHYKSEHDTRPTSISASVGISEVEQEKPLTKSGRLNLPLPPVPNQLYSGEEFECPYCLKTLCNVKNAGIWRYHVMTDLEPYICTVGGCHWSNKTYRTRKEYLEHEINAHFTSKFWDCPMCDIKIEDRAKFLSHLEYNHTGAYPPETLEAVTDICERQVTKGRDGLQCSLCKTICEDEELLLKHIADELEQLALFALPINTQKDFDERISSEDYSDDIDYQQAEVLSPGILKNLPESTDRTQVLEGIWNQEQEWMKNASGPAEEFEGQGQENSTLVKELTRQPNKRIPACKFPISTVTQPRDEDFYQRSIWNVQKIHEELRGVDMNVCLIYGPGGVGKTLLALEFAHEFTDEYDCKFWLNAETEIGLLESMRHIAETLELGLDGTEDDIEIVEIAKGWMRETGKI